MKLHTRTVILAAAALIAGAALSLPLSGVASQPAGAAVIPAAITSLTVTTPDPIKTGQTVTFSGSWSVPDHSAAGDTFTLGLPPELTWVGTTSFPLRDASGAHVATASVAADDTVTFTLTSYVTAHPTQVSGTFVFSVQYVAEQTGPGPSQLVFQVTDSVLVVPIELDGGCVTTCTPPASIVEAFKEMWWQDPQTETRLASSITAPTLTAPATTVTITDTPAPGMQLDCTSLEAFIGDEIGTGAHIINDLSATYPEEVTCDPTTVTVTWRNLPAGLTTQIYIAGTPTDTTLDAYANDGVVTIDGVDSTVTALVKRQSASGTGGGLASPGPGPATVNPAPAADPTAPEAATTTAALTEADTLAATGSDVTTGALTGAGLALVGVVIAFLAKARARKTRTA